MEFQFYILKSDEKHIVTPEPAELRFAQNASKCGMVKGIISLITPIRTTATY